MVILDGLGQRWALRILWELGHERLNFRSLQNQCDDISPTTLNARLKELRQLKLVDITEKGYGLTEQGVLLSGLLMPLNSWAENWAETL